MEPRSIGLFELSVDNARAYLESGGFPGPVVRVTELGGGVSNTVMLVETPRRRIVLKQALGRLRVAEEWLSDRGRIRREAAAMRRLAPHFPAGGIPEVLFEDAANFIFAMSAAPADAETWKSLLLSGDRCPEIAARAGGLLANLIAATWRRPDCEAEFGDQTVFRELRIDPYYRTAAARHPDLLPRFERLIESSAQRRVSLVHGDWSPKNLLVSGDLVMAIDFEVIHYGDPAFDAAFLLNHLLLKSFLMPDSRSHLRRMATVFWTALQAGLPPGTEWMERSTIEHLGCLLLARVDGKSPAEYLTSDSLKNQVRQKARTLILHPPETIDGIFAC